MKFLGSTRAQYVILNNKQLTSDVQNAEHILTLSGTVFTTTSQTTITNATLVNCTLANDNYSSLLKLDFTPTKPVKDLVESLDASVNSNNYESFMITDVPNITSDLQTSLNNNIQDHNNMLNALSTKGGGIVNNARVVSITSSTQQDITHTSACQFVINNIANVAIQSTSSGIYIIYTTAECTFNGMAVPVGRSVFSVTGSTTEHLLTNNALTMPTQSVFKVLYNTSGPVSLTFNKTYIIYDDIQNDVILDIQSTDKLLTIINKTKYTVTVSKETSTAVIPSFSSYDLYIGSSEVINVGIGSVTDIQPYENTQITVKAGEPIAKGDYVYFNNNKAYKSIVQYTSPVYTPNLRALPKIRPSGVGNDRVAFGISNQGYIVIAYRSYGSIVLSSDTNYEYLTLPSLLHSESFGFCPSLTSEMYDHQDGVLWIYYVTTDQFLHIKKIVYNKTSDSFTEAFSTSIYLGFHLSDVDLNHPIVTANVSMSINRYYGHFFDIVIIQNVTTGNRYKALRVFMDGASGALSVVDSASVYYRAGYPKFIMVKSPFFMHSAIGDVNNRHEINQLALIEVNEGAPLKVYYLRNNNLYSVDITSEPATYSDSNAHKPFYISLSGYYGVNNVIYCYRTAVQTYNLVTGLTGPTLEKSVYSVDSLVYGDRTLIPYGSFPNYVVYNAFAASSNIFISRLGLCTPPEQSYQIKNTFGGSVSIFVQPRFVDGPPFLSSYYTGYCKASLFIVGTAATNCMFNCNKSFIFNDYYLYGYRQQDTNRVLYDVYLTNPSPTYNVVKAPLVGVALNNASTNEDVTIQLSRVFPASLLGITLSNTLFYDKITNEASQGIKTPTAYVNSSGEIIILRREVFV